MDKKLQQIISQFPKQSVLVIGDAMLDVYLQGTASRICREAPVPIVSVNETEEVPGGGANTAVNCVSLGAQTFFLSAIGHDADGDRLLAALKERQVDVSFVIRDKNLRTISKQRVTAAHHLLVRFDQGNVELSDKAERKIINALEELYPQVSAVIISDYDYGILSPTIIEAIKKLQQKYKKTLIVDSKRLPLYTDLHPTLVKPNYQEAVGFLKEQAEKDDQQRVVQITALGQKLRTVTGSHIAAITLDTQGALVFSDSMTPYRTYATPQDHAKAAGAGDTYVSAFALALASKAMLTQSADIAAAATALVVAKETTTPCTREELEASVLNQEKVIASREALRAQIQVYKKAGKRIVFTNGCFDILHRGHVTYLEQAATLGDILIVGVNTDASVKRLKGPERPINTLEDRMSILSGLGSITQVISFYEDTPINLIKIIQPDVYVKGGDYTKESLPETPIVQKYGGSVEIIPFVLDRSTTNIIKKIKQSEKEQRQQPKDHSFVSLR
jgi:D-beta-D-heptose 7-phosphate kinase/D-beta-D-heptose 1-phosphate adenosyltransferase